MKEIIGRKMGMTQVYTEDGTMYAVTVIEVLPNVVTLKKTVERDGYDAIQVGYEEKKASRLTKARQGIFAKANTTTKEFLFELKGDEMNGYEVGQEIKADLFQQAKSSTSSERVKVEVMLVSLKDGDTKLDLKDTEADTTEVKVHLLTMVDATTVLFQAKRCQDTWEIKAQQF